ncbi:hypothetical protein ACGFMM_06730 [Streptomyces sp. NPDC048604]|uniref:hypothetical protein n=1 Tax=Streptomyces sp. NPDC048604 TaxID=3365578 RepID=UPI00371B7253
MRARDTAVPAAALLCLAGAAPAAAADAWTAGPAAGRPYVYLEGAAGSVLQDTVSVTNSGARPVSVRLTGAGGTGQKASVPLALAARAVTVPARTRADVPFAVTVPADAAPGERTGTVVVSAGGREVPVRVHLRISGPRLAALTVERVRVDDAGTVHYTLVNRGNTALAPRLSVRADGVFGTVLDRPARALPLTLRPGERRALTEPWPDRPALDAVTVQLTVTAGDGARATARAEARFASAGAPAVLGGALLAAAAAAGRALRRQRRTPPEPPDEEQLLTPTAAGASR